MPPPKDEDEDENELDDILEKKANLGSEFKLSYYNVMLYTLIELIFLEIKTCKNA